MESRTQSSSEDGFTLAALLVILTIISIVIAYTVPEQWSMIMARERDKQTIFAMKQAARAIRLWQRKTTAAPTSLDQLKEANKPRMLRLTNGEFPMPLTGSEEDWILVPVGALEQQAPIAPNQPQPTNPATNPGAAQQPTLTPPSKLNKAASPKDYVGAFVGIRPNKEGKSFLSLNGAEDYSEWVYTVQDLENEIQMRIAAINVK